MTKTGIENKKIEKDKFVEAEKIKQQDRASDKSLLGNIIGSVGRVASGFAKGINDVSWYKNNTSELTASVSSLALQIFQGSLVLNRLSTPISDSGTLHQCAVVGILAVPNYRLSDSVSDTDNALNISAQRLFTGLRALNSRVGEYEQGDVMQVFIASASLASFILNLARAIRAAQTFSGARRYIGDAILLHCCYSPSEFRTNLAQYKEIYNQMVQFFNENIVLPLDFAYAKREFWKMSNVFTDQDLACGQVVMFDYPGYYTYDEANATLVWNTVSAGNSFYFYSHSGQTFDLAGVKAIFHEMYDVLVYSAALTTMYADIKAGAIQLVKLPTIYDDAGLTFLDLDEVKHQIMNMKLPLIAPNVSGQTRVPVHTYTYSTNNLVANTTYTFLLSDAATSWQVGDITQNASGLLKVPYVNIDVTANVMYKADDSASSTLNYYTNDISADELLTSTRLTARWSQVNNTYACITGGMDVAIAISFTTYNGGVLTTTYGNAAILTSDYAGYHAHIMNHINRFFQLDWAPEAYLCSGGIGLSTSHIIEVWQLGNPCVINVVNLNLLHRVCALSLFSLPAAGAVNSSKVYSSNTRSSGRRFRK